MIHEKTISDLAYHLWHARGCPEGSADVDWAEAERQVRGKAPGSADRAFEAPEPAGGTATPPRAAAGQGSAATRADFPLTTVGPAAESASTPAPRASKKAK